MSQPNPANIIDYKSKTQMFTPLINLTKKVNKDAATEYFLRFATSLPDGYHVQLNDKNEIDAAQRLVGHTLLVIINVRFKQGEFLPIRSPKSTKIENAAFGRIELGSNHAYDHDDSAVMVIFSFGDPEEGSTGCGRFKDSGDEED